MFHVGRVTNVLHKVTKAPLPLFFVDLEPQIQSNDIFQLASLLHTKVRVEEPYKTKIISQRNNCQEYGHTKTYCGYPVFVAVPIRSHLNVQSHVRILQNAHSAQAITRRATKDAPSIKTSSVPKKPFSKGNFAQTYSRPNSSNVKDTHPSNDTHPNHSNAHTPTYAQATSGRATNNTTSESTTDLNTTITKFLEDFKSLINPLLSLLTKVIEKLLIKA